MNRIVYIALCNTRYSNYKACTSMENTRRLFFGNCNITYFLWMSVFHISMWRHCFCNSSIWLLNIYKHNISAELLFLSTKNDIRKLFTLNFTPGIFNLIDPIDSAKLDIVNHTTISLLLQTNTRVLLVLNQALLI